MNTFEEGMAVVKRIEEETGATWAMMRRVGSDHLQEGGWPEGHGISSSDVNHHLASMGNHDADELRRRAEEAVWQARTLQGLMESTGKTEAQVLADLRRMFEEV